MNLMTFLGEADVIKELWTNGHVGWLAGLRSEGEGVPCIFLDERQGLSRHGSVCEHTSVPFKFIW